MVHGKRWDRDQAARMGQTFREIFCSSSFHLFYQDCRVIYWALAYLHSERAYLPMYHGGIDER